MVKIVGVRFKAAGKMYYFNPSDIDVKKGDHVIVETSRGIEYGEVAAGIKEVDDNMVVKPLKEVVRIATAEDEERYKTNKEKEKEAYKVCSEKIESHKLDMKLIEVEYTFDGSKILFYFTAEGRVDFRDLVKDLASVFKTRIELRQIGVRDESKTLGSIGVCGRNLCCSQFLGEFVPVSIKMAKEQGLSLNPTKISGACGRLMCCLKYEQETYEDLMKSSPKNGARVETPEGEGTVVSVALLRGMVKVRLGDGEEVTLKDFSVDELSFEGHRAQITEKEDDFFAEEDKAIMESMRRFGQDDDEQQVASEKKPAKKQKNQPQSENRTPQQDSKKGKKPFKKRNFKKNSAPNDGEQE